MPGYSGMAEREVSGMEDFRKNFGGFDETRTGAVEKGVSVYGKDLLVFYGVQLSPARESCEGGHLGLGALEIESTWRDDNEIWIGDD